MHKVPLGAHDACDLRNPLFDVQGQQTWHLESHTISLGVLHMQSIPKAAWHHSAARLLCLGLVFDPISLRSLHDIRKELIDYLGSVHRLRFF